MEVKTTLYDTHVKYKGKMVPFAGFLLPVQYEEGVIAEHMAVRNACGLFDVSHMGEITCKGKDAVKNLNYLLTNEFSNMYDGQAKYSPMCNESGGIVDDLIVYKIKDNDYLLVVNASNIEKDFHWIKKNMFGEVIFENRSNQFGQLALQGPKARTILEKVMKREDIPIKFYSCYVDKKISKVNCIVSKTGYTGEDGFEIYMLAEDAPMIWETLMKEGKEDGLVPCGLGARDTLRLEAGMPLYGHEMQDDISPKEAGLSFFVKMDKENFIGKKALEDQSIITRKRVGLKITGRGIARENAPIYVGETQVGITTSGTHAPYLGFAIAMGMVDIEQKEPGTQVEIEVRGRRIKAEVVTLPFYKK